MWMIVVADGNTCVIAKVVRIMRIMRGFVTKTIFFKMHPLFKQAAEHH